VEPQPVDGIAPGTVLSQSPASASTAYPGDNVIIVVAEQPATVTPP